MRFIGEFACFVLCFLGTPIFKIMTKFSFVKIGDEKYAPIRPADFFIFPFISGCATLLVIALTTLIWIKVGLISSIVVFMITVALAPFCIRHVCMDILDMILKSTLEKITKNNEAN